MVMRGKRPLAHRWRSQSWRSGPPRDGNRGRGRFGFNAASLTRSRFGLREAAARRLRGPLRKRPRAAPPPEPEATLNEQPLRSGGTLGPLASARDAQADGWTSALHDELRRSFVSYRPSNLPEGMLREWFHMLSHRVDWHRPKVGQRKIPRSAAWLTAEPCKCTYRYSGTAWPALPMEGWFQDITDEVCRLCGIRERPNSCNANYYEDGSQSVGWHTDDEPLFNATRQDALIISLSLGATRSFMLRPNDAPEDVVRMRLNNGDICTMEGLTQKHYKHCVPPEKHVGYARINLTWRWVVAHDDGCPGVEVPPIRPRATLLARKVVLVEDEDETDNERAVVIQSDSEDHEDQPRRRLPHNQESADTDSDVQQHQVEEHDRDEPPQSAPGFGYGSSKKGTDASRRVQVDAESEDVSETEDEEDDRSSETDDRREESVERRRSSSRVLARSQSREAAPARLHARQHPRVSLRKRERPASDRESVLRAKLEETMGRKRQRVGSEDSRPPREPRRERPRESPRSRPNRGLRNALFEALHQRPPLQRDGGESFSRDWAPTARKVMLKARAARS
eukprot:TRINITY_DN15435_c2_g2_i2.p1 TRINITY_DN15435_c2_g2~~TRINITY_DN15435_c2_g2_i2.p1  ORF type:complete len:566 (+),score=46.46 TRINITY_DN15435_c2_g2_i2:111-1808(+)